MILILVLILSEVLALAVLRQHFYRVSGTRYKLFIVFHISLSIWLWILAFTVLNNDSFFDTARNISNLMSLAGMICAVVIPRFFLAACHFFGKLINRKRGGHLRWLTNAGLLLSIFALLLIAIGTFYGRNNFRYEQKELGFRNLPPDLDGFRIVQVSDMHLAGFLHHKEKLLGVMQRINEFEPDLVINTGDFVTFGWREYEGFDSILAVAKGRYGQYAIPGNHDAGTYHPEYTGADIENNVARISYLAGRSGYTMLRNSFSTIKVGNTNVVITGVTTGGRHPRITHGDIDEAERGLDSVDFEILLTHDPNHWIQDVAGKRYYINLTLSGHTHGMQLGIVAGDFRWSPVKIYYPNWNGIYSKGDQLQYVNRGLGVLAVPFRIWMPPEISILTLKRTG